MPFPKVRDSFDNTFAIATADFIPTKFVMPKEKVQGHTKIWGGHQEYCPTYSTLRRSRCLY